MLDKPPAPVSSPRLDRLANLGQPAKRRKPDVLPALTKQHLTLIELMVHGCDHDGVRKLSRRVSKVMDGETVWVDRQLEPGEPLQLDEAAILAGVRQRNARELFAMAIFQTELTREVHRLRESAKPAAMARLIELRDRVGHGKAADAKVQLAASQALLGDAVGTKPTVNVNVGVGVNVTAGYVIDLSEPDDAPTIDGDAR